MALNLLCLSTFILAIQSGIGKPYLGVEVGVTLNASIIVLLSLSLSLSLLFSFGGGGG